ncbi:DNA primase small subunit-like [Sycon ciliatum]|uniref:DNA primase small subunit-like n=1 Tax=Sycon ciliatum TaxID=27933 RepID=UPI0031F6C916
MASSYDEMSPKDLLAVYYGRLFPYTPFYRWLSYGGLRKNYLANREFSFTLDGDIYIRYLSFSEQSDFEKELQQKNPCKIDIGAVFSHKPRDHKAVQASAFRAEEKELVFDIDMTDYDDVRNCCSGAAICEKCWPLMTVAIHILHRALTVDFGYKHLLFVYSGRRGVHCWVCDEAARQLSASGRSAIAEYLSVIKGGECQTKKVQLRGSSMHSSLQHASQVIKKYFPTLALENQDILGTPERYEKVLSLIPSEDVRKFLREKWSHKSAATSFDRWSELESAVANQSSKDMTHCIEEIQFQYTYPRLDVNVSKGVNHLLKSPFSVHPKTGRVCVPISYAAVDSFDPFTVPTVNELCRQLDECVAKEAEADSEQDAVEPGRKRKRMPEWAKTELEQAVSIFSDFVKKMELEWHAAKQESRDMDMSW